MRDGWDTILQMVLQPNGELTAHIGDMDAVMREAWRPINLRCEHQPEPSLDVFMQHYKQHIRSNPM